MRKSFVMVLVLAFVLSAVYVVAAQYSADTMKKIEELKIMSRDKKDMADSMSGVKKMTAEELKSWTDQKKKFVLLDNRVPADYEKERIAGAIRLSPDDLLENPKKAEQVGLKKDDIIVNY
jgi:hypothetical protein